ncbi:Facilitated trehalose transporter Tret1-2 [Folsomia candida]|uniref:Facilitated trehalose transporter Tret1-2 n=1 Tax=Folsomia candida TaxID=158441 RepID=A0A226EI83_FOLCA|nr:Facilitated trehalose transporter Tret1-2 [Folsomia candida]
MASGGQSNLEVGLQVPLPTLPRKKKSSVYVYTRFPEINDNEEGDDDDGDEEEIEYADLKGRPVHRRTQLLGALAANMGALALGTVLSWPAVALPNLRVDPDFTGNLTTSQESWIGSIVSLGAVAAGPVGGVGIELFGRRKAMLVCSVPFFMGWMLIHFASSVSHILVGRFVTGFFAGTFAVAAPIFTGEVTDAGIRGAVGSTFDMMISLGILFIYVVGTFVSWRVQALICSVVPVVIFLLMLVVPESPVYLVKKGRMSEGAEALMRYRGATRIQQIQTEFEEMSEAENSLEARLQKQEEALEALKSIPQIIAELKSSLESQGADNKRKSTWSLGLSDEEDDSNQDEINALIGKNPSTDDELQLQEVNELLNDIEKQSDLGPSIMENVAQSFAKTINRPLSKETKAKLREAIKIPENCKDFSAPKINNEIWRIIPSHARLSDVKSQQNQQALGCGMSALALISNMALQHKKDLPKELLAAIIKTSLDASNIMGDQFQQIIRMVIWVRPERKSEDIKSYLKLNQKHISKHIWHFKLQSPVPSIPRERAVSPKQLSTKFQLPAGVENKSTIQANKELNNNSVRVKADSEINSIEESIQKMLKSAAIIPCDNEMGQFVSTVFTVPKPDGTRRPILNLKKLNEFMESPHFKMETIKTATELISNQCFMAVVDLRDAYHAISISERSQKYLKFRWKGKLYKYTCLPFGLSLAPFLYTKLTKPVVAKLRVQGILLSLPSDKTEAIINKCKQAQACKTMTIQKLAELVGSLVAAVPAVRYGLLYTRQFEMEKMANEACVQEGSWVGGFSTVRRRMCEPWILLPVGIGFCIFAFQVISGLDPVLVYTVDIFHMAGAQLDEYTSTIIIGTMQTLAGVVAASLVERCGRRVLLLVSEGAMVVALGMLGVYFYLKEANGGVMPVGLGWLPVTSLAVYVLSYSVGMGPVGYTLMGEILPLQVKGLAGCILTSAKWFMSFLVTKFFQDLLFALGSAGCFWLFGAFCAAGFIFVAAFVPETKGRSLDEIQQEFRLRFSAPTNSPDESEPLLLPVGISGRYPGSSSRTVMDTISESSQKLREKYAAIV